MTAKKKIYVCSVCGISSTDKDRIDNHENACLKASHYYWGVILSIEEGRAVFRVSRQETTGENIRKIEFGKAFYQPSIREEVIVQWAIFLRKYTDLEAGIKALICIAISGTKSLVKAVSDLPKEVKTIKAQLEERIYVDIDKGAEDGEDGE